jgi:hypothetical protein
MELNPSEEQQQLIDAWVAIHANESPNDSTGTTRCRPAPRPCAAGMLSPSSPPELKLFRQRCPVA